MTTKTYKASTNVSINVVLDNKKNLHVSFTPQSDGSSVFTTESEEIQKGIERHYNYGKLFRLAEVTETDAAEDEEPGEGAAGAETKDGQGAETLRKVAVSDLASAKDYLADTFGISRTAMRSAQAIMKLAAANGVEFEGLE